MEKIINLCRTYILEICLVLISVAVIAGYCYGFNLLDEQTFKVFLAIGALVFEAIVMLVLNAFFPKPGDSSPFMLIYMIAFIILTVVICAYSILYLICPIMVATTMFLFAIVLFFLSLVFVVCHRTTALYRDFTKDI